MAAALGNECRCLGTQRQQWQWHELTQDDPWRLPLHMLGRSEFLPRLQIWPPAAARHPWQLFIRNSRLRVVGHLFFSYFLPCISQSLWNSSFWIISLYLEIANPVRKRSMNSFPSPKGNQSSQKEPGMRMPKNMTSSCQRRLATPPLHSPFSWLACCGQAALHFSLRPLHLLLCLLACCYRLME